MRSYGGGRVDWHGPCAARRDLAGGGLHNVKRAGFNDRYFFHEEQSQVVLPRLDAAGTRIQFALIDGWHTFDHTLVDFFFIDRMLDVGGIIVLDDVGYPSICRLCHFILANRNYSTFDVVSCTPSRTLKTKLKRFFKQSLIH